MTAQIGERLPYQGDDMTRATEPLEAYFALGGERPSFGFVSTALWRDYVGHWEIVDDRLHLVGINAAAFRDEPLPLERLFPAAGTGSSHTGAAASCGCRRAGS